MKGRLGGNLGGGYGGGLGSGLEPHVEARFRWVIALVFLVFSIFLLRLFQLQVVQGDALRVRSERNWIRTLRLEAPRGHILDREERVLAGTRPAFELRLIPSEMRNPDRTFNALGQLVGDDPERLRARVGKPRGRQRFQPVVLVGDLSHDQYARIESHRYAMPAVTTDKTPWRDYLGGTLAAHLLGSIGEVQQKQLTTRAFADYRAGEIVGQSGIEAVLEAHLRGRAGGRNVVVDVAGREVEVLDEVEPQAGGDVVLTLDLDLQRTAEQALHGERERVRAGAVVALDPRNGDVLALASSPAYDPNLFVGGMDRGSWKELNQNPRHPLHDRAVAGEYPPGSTYKPIVALAALEESLVTPNKRFYCPGEFTLGNHTYRCWKREGHGWMDMHQAMVQSCDVYFYNLGKLLGIDRLAFFARGFQLGRSAELGLPQDQAGLVPTSAWKQHRFGQPWVAGETISAAIGQGYNLVTPLQLALAYAAIANDGVLVKPRLVLRTQKPDGSVVEETSPSFHGTVPVAERKLKLVQKALEGVVHDPGGTGRRARVKGVRVAGKTGTAQVVSLEHVENKRDADVRREHRDHAWFASYAPAQAPEIVVVALVEHGGNGSTAAAPVAQKVLEAYFAKQTSQGQTASLSGLEAGRAAN